MAACRGLDSDPRGLEAPLPSEPAPILEVLEAPVPLPCVVAKTEIDAAAELVLHPQSSQVRAETLGRARATPVYFAEVPPASGELPKRFDGLAQRLNDLADPAAEILGFLKATRDNLGARRALFLRDGYLFAETPILALRMTQTLRLDHLFNQPELQVERGVESFKVIRDKGRYYQIDQDGERRDATLLLNDRILEPGETRAPLHLDFADLRHELGFRSLEVLRSTQRGLWVRFVYGGDPHAETLIVEGAVRRAGTRAELECELIPAEKEAKLAEIRQLEQSWYRSFVPLKEAIGQIVELRLPFDEPRTEYGQEDGKLRRAFREAYDRGREVYEYNDDRYYVFDSNGRVRLPEVCIDFVSDAFDWATGGSWAPRGQKRLHVRGALNLPSLPIENSRSIESLLAFARTTPDWFQVRDWAPSERTSFRDRSRFFEGVRSRAEFLRLGDVVFINGLRDDERYHYHSFFIYDLDPMTGVPTLLAANAGPPQMRTWEGEMAGAPRRFVVARLRVRSSVLESAYEQAKAQPGVPLTLPEPVQAAPSALVPNTFSSPALGLPLGG